MAFLSVARWPEVLTESRVDFGPPGECVGLLAGN